MESVELDFGMEVVAVTVAVSVEIESKSGNGSFVCVFVWPLVFGGGSCRSFLEEGLLFTPSLCCSSLFFDGPV